MVCALGIFLTAWLLRLAAVYFLQPSAVMYSDALSFFNIASSLAAGDGYLLNGSPTAYRAPGFPFFLGSIFRIFGTSVQKGLLAQTLVSAASVVLLYAIAKQLKWTPKAQWTTAVLAAVYPFFLYYTGALITETWTVFLVCICFWSYFRWKELPTMFTASLWGFILALLTLTKPTFLFIALAWFFMELSWKRSSGLALSFIFFLFPLTGWALRNYQHFKTPVLDTHGGITCMECMVYYEDNKAGRFSETTSLPANIFEQAKALNEVERDRFYMQQYKNFILENPSLFIERMALNTVDFWRFYPRQDLNSMGPGKQLAFWMSLATEPFLLFAGFFGLWRMRKQAKRFFPFYVLILGLFAAHALTCAQMRYRLPLMPVFILFSAYTLFPPLPSRENNAPHH